jgi:hypothetical protein
MVWKRINVIFDDSESAFNVCKFPQKGLKISKILADASITVFSAKRFQKVAAVQEAKNVASDEQKKNSESVKNVAEEAKIL